MHRIALNPAVVQATLARRGRQHVFADLEPRLTALLVVDMQNAYLDEVLDNSFVQHALDIVPNINRIAQSLRRAGEIVVWIQNNATEESLDSWSTYNRRMLTPERCERRFSGIAEGMPGHEIWPGLDVHPDDHRVKKTRYSAFIPGASTLELLLRGRGIDTVVVTGTGTGTCCESTARDAMMLNFATIMVSDGNACATDEEHNASLTAFYRNFGDVMTTDELVRFIKTNGAVSESAAQ